jgi:hypothetical protein
MQRGHEEATQESARRRPRPVRWLGPERGQEAGQPRKRAQGRPGKKPKEENCLAAQCSTATTRAPEKGMSAAVASIRARFGYRTIGVGYAGIRYSAPALR